MFELIASGLTQKEVATRLNISQQAVSLRARTAHGSLELDAIPALARVLTRLDCIDGQDA